LVKDESRLPTGSFKARGMALAISKANELGIRRVAAPTAGNAGGAMAAYAARAGMEAYVFMPQDTSAINAKECWLAGAKTFYVNGLINDCGRIVPAADRLGPNLNPTPIHLKPLWLTRRAQNESARPQPPPRRRPTPPASLNRTGHRQWRIRVAGSFGAADAPEQLCRS